MDKAARTEMQKRHGCDAALSTAQHGTVGLARGDDTPLLRLSDVRMAVQLLIGAPVAWLLPTHCWYFLCRHLATLITTLRSSQARQSTARVLAIVGDHAKLADPASPHYDYLTSSYLNLLCVLRQHRPWANGIDVKLLGAEHIEMGLHASRGVILWRSSFVFGTVVESLGLNRAGYLLYHLTRPEHGLSSSRLGAKLFNPVLLSIEDRYLEERVMYGDKSAASMLTLAKHLRHNRIVSMRSHHHAHSVLEVPFLDGTLRLASGPAELALLTGATLLPVVTIMTANCEFEVRVGPAIDLQHGLEREATLVDAVSRYVEHIKPFVLTYPGQWISWFHRQASPREADQRHGPRRVPGLAASDSA